MECEHCHGEMVEEQLVVVGGLVRVKGVSAWHCSQCGRLEYGYLTDHTKLLPLAAKTQAVV